MKGKSTVSDSCFCLRPLPFVLHSLCTNTTLLLLLMVSVNLQCKSQCLLLLTLTFFIYELALIICVLKTSLSLASRPLHLQFYFSSLFLLTLLPLLDPNFKCFKTLILALSLISLKYSDVAVHQAGSGLEDTFDWLM